MNIELYLIRVLFFKKTYDKYSKFIKEDFLKSNSKELYKLLQGLHLFHKTFPEKDVPSVEEFEVFFYAQHSATDDKTKQAFAPIFESLAAISPDPEVAEQVFKKHIERVRATEIALLGLKVTEEKATFEELQEFARDIASEDTQEALDSIEVVDDDLDYLLEQVADSKGLPWRLKTMNKMLGPLRKGDFGFLFKRPETGGTTFLTDQSSFMIDYLEDRPVLWINNEEQGGKVLTRFYQSRFGVTLAELKDKREYYGQAFKDEIKGKFKLVDNPAISRRDVDRACDAFNPGLIIIDQIDKVKGFQNDRNDLELKEIYQWARELSKNYGPVIGVCQAGGTAEGKKWLTMDDVDSSKTAKQGEADWILGIGKSNQDGYEQVRYLHLSKNKLVGGAETIPELRHGKSEVLIYPEIARYRDIG